MTEDKPASLLDLARSKVKTKGPDCTFRHLLPNPAIEELLANTGNLPDGRKRGDGLPYSVAGETLTDSLGFKVNGDTVSRHLRNKCGCEPS